MPGQVQNGADDSRDPAWASARSAWEALARHGLTPSPRNYELLHAFFSGANPPLAERLAPCLAPGGTLTEEQANTLYDACIAGTSTEARMLDGVGQLAEVAGALA